MNEIVDPYEDGLLVDHRGEPLSQRKADEEAAERERLEKLPTCAYSSCANKATRKLGSLKVCAECFDDRRTAPEDYS